MNSNIQQYDVAVVYSGSIARSVQDKEYMQNSPFSARSRYGIYNDSYRYFLLKCQEMGIKIAFTTSKDIIGSGLFQSFWTYENKWVRNKGKAYARILFDKFTPTTNKQKEKLALLTASKSIYLFNKKKISDIFQNKLHTYKHFKKFAIPTVEIANPCKRTITLAKIKLDKLLQKHKYKADFHDGYIVKDTTGAGGFKIFKVDFAQHGAEEIIEQYKVDKKGKKLLSYVLQPFINCTDGFVFGKYRGLIDLRLIILNRKIVQTYIRVAKKGNFKCNEHQGGNLVYMPVKTAPKDVLAMTGKIIKNLGTELNLKHSLYASDFIRSNNGNLYFIEGNSNPGIDWNHKKKINEIRSKELMNLIASELKSLVQEAAPIPA